MKNLSSTIILSALLTFAFTSCTKEAGIKQDDKLSAADCPRLAGLTAEKKEALYTVTTFAGSEIKLNYTEYEGVLCKAHFDTPWGISVMKDGVIYISDYLFHNIRKIDKGIVSTFAGMPSGSNYCEGEIDGIGTSAHFCTPKKMVQNDENNLIVLDQNGYGALRKVSSNAQVSTVITNMQRESGYEDGPLAQAKFNYFISVTTNSNGAIYLYEENNLIRKISKEGIVSTFAGQPPVNGEIQRGYKDGPKENALFGFITDITFAPNGSLYLCDVGNKKIRRITPTGAVETVADLPPASPVISYDYFLAISDSGIVYIAISTQVFKIDSDGITSHIAGSEISDHKDGVGSKARFTELHQMAIHKNYLYLTDGSTIRRMNIE
ncbi:MAG: hypothetical protein H7Y07_17260 [Pyrinomonadaceae bacterium]|nr:hypothetical protein [Sphingobacteriaceae bacterium]